MPSTREQPQLIKAASAAERATPPTLQISSALWICAVLAGVAESVLGVLGAARSGVPIGDLWLNITVRGVIYALLIFTALQLASGRRWPRPVLAVGLGVIGLGTLIVEPVRSILDGTAVSIGAFLSTAPMIELGFAVVRTCHIAFVLVALALMFAPPANAFYRRQVVGSLQ